MYADPARNYVFGQGNIQDRVALFSVVRMDGRLAGMNPEAHESSRFLKRCLSVFAHEVGHLAGMKHCVYYECLMNGSNNLDELDRQPPHLCPVCLRKLAFTTPFDPARRCRSLAEFDAAHGLDEEASWLRDRARWIEEAD